MELDLQKFFNESKNIQETLEQDKTVLQHQRTMDVQEIADAVYAKCQQIQEVMIQFMKSGAAAEPTGYQAKKLYENWSDSWWLRVTFDKSSRGYFLVVSVYKFNPSNPYGFCITEDNIDEWFNSINSLPFDVLKALGQQDIVSLAEKEIVAAVERRIRKQCDTNKALGRR